jgi:asparagine synthase (glutamine-hydrolysing)
MWLRGALREWAEELLDPQRLKAEGYFDVDIVRHYWDEHQSGEADWAERLWAVLSFQAWLDGGG